MLKQEFVANVNIYFKATMFFLMKVTHSERISFGKKIDKVTSTKLPLLSVP